jgi:hypothetical protein
MLVPCHTWLHSLPAMNTDAPVRGGVGVDKMRRPVAQGCKLRKRRSRRWSNSCTVRWKRPGTSYLVHWKHCGESVAFRDGILREPGLIEGM